MHFFERPLTARHHLFAALFGAAFALSVSVVLQRLEARYAIVLLLGIVILSAALAIAHHLRDVLLYGVVLLIPLASIEKTFFVSGDVTFVTPGISVGPLDLCLFALYALWIVRILAQQEQRPGLSTVDTWVIVFIAAHGLSALNSVSSGLTIREVMRLSKFALLFFYVEHQVERRHLKYIFAALLCGIMLQAALGVVQQRTGSLLGIGRTKGATDQSYEQYTVTGFEAVRRAEGTTFDSHALALYFAMTLAIPLGLALTRELPVFYRAVAATAFTIGVQGLVASFARAGWVAFAGSGAILIWYLVRWKEWRRIGLITAIAVALGVPALVPFAPQIRLRLFEAPPELVSARFETITMGLEMWRDSPITGIGANGYMRALELKMAISEGDPYFIPAHNMIVFVLVEIGVVGLAAFLLLSVAVARQLWRAARTPDPLLRTLAVAILGGFVGCQLQGLSDPIYVTTVTYVLLWFLLGLGAAVSRMAAMSVVQQPAAAA